MWILMVYIFLSIFDFRRTLKMEKQLEENTKIIYEFKKQLEENTKIMGKQLENTKIMKKQLEENKKKHEKLQLINNINHYIFAITSSTKAEELQYKIGCIRALIPQCIKLFTNYPADDDTNKIELSFNNIIKFDPGDWFRYDYADKTGRDEMINEIIAAVQYIRQKRST